MVKRYLAFRKQDCMGCHTCEVACKQEHGLGVGPRLIKVIENSPNFIPVYCHHCAKAPCAEVCPVGAISRNDEGIVLIDNDACIGCRECVEACPFDAMQFAEQNDIAVKCDLCFERLAEKKQPACVSICPTGCLQLGGSENIASVFERAQKE